MAAKTQKVTRTNNISVGNAGEYFVAGELERRGFSVAVPMSNVKDFDLLIFHRVTHRKYSIQVKTTATKYKRWMMSEKNESLNHKDHFYVFVALNHYGEPSYHIVPSKVVAEQVKSRHQKWLKTPGRKGQKHNDSKMRQFEDLSDKWKDHWWLLEP